MINDLKCLEWRKYVRAISFAYEKGIEIPDEILSAPIIQIPEHYKLTALRDYSIRVKPVSEKYILKMQNAINSGGCVQSYKDHLTKELGKFAVNKNT